MKLCAYSINGTPASDIGTWTSEDVGGTDAFVAIKDTDSVPTGYVDISSIENWDKWGYNAGCDYKLIRTEISKLEQFQVWANLTTAEKAVCARLFVVDKSKRDEIYTTVQQIQLGLLFHKYSVECRTTRFAYASMEVYNRLAPSEAATVVSEIEADGLPTKYIQFGHEGTEVGDPEGLFDYLQSVVGTGYATTGLSSKAYVPDGMTLPQLVDRIMDILRDGDY